MNFGQALIQVVQRGKKEKKKRVKKMKKMNSEELDELIYTLRQMVIEVRLAKRALKNDKFDFRTKKLWSGITKAFDQIKMIRQSINDLGYEGVVDNEDAY